MAETLKPARGVDLAQVLPVTAVLAALGATVLVTCWLYRRGRTPALERGVAWAEQQSGLPGWAAIPALVSSVSLLTAGFGFYWDVAVHIDRGRDSSPFGTPAHWPIVIGLCGLALAGILAIALDKDVDGKAAVVLPGGLRCSLGGALVLLCGSISLLGFPLDDIWHNIFGQDVTLWSPTHIQMIGGASLTTLATWVLLEEGRRRASGIRGSNRLAARLMRPQPMHLAGAFLIGLSTLQDEFDMGVPQFNAIYHPILLSLAAGIGLVAARVRIGPGAALRAAVFFIVVRGIWMLVIGYGFSLTIPHMPLYLAEAALVELVALAVPVSRQLRFGAVCGLLIGTVGVAAEWAWSQVAFPLPWGAVLWQGYVLAAVVGVAAGVLGGLTGRALLPAAAPRAAAPRLAVGLAFAAVLGVIAVALPIQEHAGWQADVRVTSAGPHEATLQVRLEPASVADDVAWFNVTSWQGGDLVSGHGLRLTGLHQVSDGVWQTDGPVPVAGDYKTVLRLATGTSQQAVPIYLPEDKAIPAEGVAAAPHFTRSFVQDQKILQREAIGGSPALKHAAYAVLGVLALLWIAALSLGLRRLDRSAVAPSAQPLRLAGTPA
ncbi:MAG: hypothetical protein ABR549_01370 [Mycobacteriales bacterium]